MCGRGSRVIPGVKSTFLILDYGNNVSRHGFWQQPRKWELKTEGKRKSEKLGITPIKLCSNCNAMIPLQAKICEVCGATLNLTKDQAKFMWLQELAYEDLMREAYDVGIKELEEMRLARGYKMGWILRTFKTKQQFQEYGKLRKFKPGWAWTQARRYGI